MRHDPALGIALVDHGFEDLDTLPRNLRATQPANQLFALAGKHRPDDDFDPAHVSFHDIHAPSPDLQRQLYSTAEFKFHPARRNLVITGTPAATPSRRHLG